MIDEKTKNLALPLPHQDNLLDEDLPRLRAAFKALDDFAARNKTATETAFADLRAETEAREAGEAALTLVLEMEMAAWREAHTQAQEAGEAALARALETERAARLAADEVEAAARAALPREHAVGAFDLAPFRPEDLPEFMPGWYFANGDRFLLSTPQGQALQSLPANYKTDWGVTLGTAGEGEPTINLPSLFHTDGRGFFPRPVNGVSRAVGSVAEDQVRRIQFQLQNGTNEGGAFWRKDYVETGSPDNIFSVGGNHGSQYGAVTRIRTSNEYFSWLLLGDVGMLGINFAGEETHPLERGMTPVVYLGV